MIHANMYNMNQTERYCTQSSMNEPSVCILNNYYVRNPVAARSEVWVCDCSPAETVCSNPTGGHGCLAVVSVVCCQVDVSATS